MWVCTIGMLITRTVCGCVPYIGMVIASKMCGYVLYIGMLITSTMCECVLYIGMVITYTIFVCVIVHTEVCWLQVLCWYVWLCTIHNYIDSRYYVDMCWCGSYIGMFLTGTMLVCVVMELMTVELLRLPMQVFPCQRRRRLLLHLLRPNKRTSAVYSALSGTTSYKYIQAYMHMYTYICIYVCMYIFIYLFMLYICMYTVYVCMYVCMYELVSCCVWLQRR